MYKAKQTVFIEKVCDPELVHWIDWNTRLSWSANAVTAAGSGGRRMTRASFNTRRIVSKAVICLRLVSGSALLERGALTRMRWFMTVSHRALKYMSALTEHPFD